MSTALARYLKDFGEPQVPQPAQELLPDFGSEGPAFAEDFAFPEEPVAQAPDLEALRQEAYAEGYETACVELSARHAEEIEALRQHYAEEQAQLRQKFDEEMATILSQSLRKIAESVSLSVSEEVADCLAPVLQEEIAVKSVKAMAALVREAILEGEAGQIIVKGPFSLFNILATEMGEDAAMLRHVEAADLDLTVEQGGSVLVTRLSAFAASLKKVLE